MNADAAVTFIGAEEYLLAEEASLVKNEYYKGKCLR